MASHADSRKAFEEVITETVSSVGVANKSLEKLIDELNVDGQLRKVDEFQRQELIELSIRLKDMGESSEKFQKDAEEAYGFNTVALRNPRGRTRDSGYGSKSIAHISKISEDSSGIDSLTKRQSNVNDESCLTPLKQVTTNTSPLVSVKPGTNSENCLEKNTSVPSFYLETPKTSSASLASADPNMLATDLSNSTCEGSSVPDNHGDKVAVSKMNNLSKPPSEEDNLKQPY